MTLHIRLFGGVRVERDDTGAGASFAPIALARHLQQLLCFLLCHRGRQVPREVLIETLWPDMEADRGGRCLNSALYRLRGKLGAPSDERNVFIETPMADSVAFRVRAPYWLDVDEFETCVEQYLDGVLDNPSPDHIERLEHAVSLYQGDILSGVYEEWAIVERERLKNIYLDTLYGLTMHYGRTNRPDKVIRFGREILNHDGLREDVHRTLMRAYMASGDRPGAMRQYAVCRDLLRHELSIDPMPETQSLYRELADGASADCASRFVDPPSSTTQMTRERIHSMREKITRLRLNSNRFHADVEEIDRALRALERTPPLSK